MSVGFVTIDRAIWEHEIFSPSPMSEREAFIWMISSAAYADTQHRVGCEMVEVKRGSFMVTLRKMQEFWGWKSDTKVRNYLKKLKNNGILSVETLGKGKAKKTHITICNYNEYQSPERTKNAQETHNKRTKNAVNNKITNNNTKEDTNVSSKKDVSSPPSKSNGSRLPSDWFLPKEWGEWAVSQGASVDLIRHEAEKFKDYWHSVAGAKGRKADWYATWRNWIRKKLETQKKPQLKAINGGNHERFTSRNELPNGPQNRPDPALENIVKLLGLEEA